MVKKSSSKTTPSKSAKLRRTKSVKRVDPLRKDKRMTQLYMAGIRTGRLKPAGYLSREAKDRPNEHGVGLRKTKNTRKK